MLPGTIMWAPSSVGTSRWTASTACRSSGARKRVRASTATAKRFISVYASTTCPGCQAADSSRAQSWNLSLWWGSRRRANTGRSRARIGRCGPAGAVESPLPTIWDAWSEKGPPLSNSAPLPASSIRWTSSGALTT
nr:hypothetical protein [Streptomyces tailanensis]